MVATHGSGCTAMACSWDAAFRNSLIMTASPKGVS